MNRDPVHRVAGPEAEAVVDVLCEAFVDYPVMRFILDPDTPDRDRKLRTLVRFFVAARRLRGEPILGVGDCEDLDGAAIVSRPSGSPSPPELLPIRERAWRELGAEARTRYEAFGAACAPFQVDAPHLHLNMVGVRRRARGSGVGRALVEHVHRLSRAEPESEGVTLTTEDPANVPLYEHLGYHIVGRATVAPGLETWGFYRPDRD